MKTLEELLSGLLIKQLIGPIDVPVAELCFESKKAVAHACFVAIVGTQADGHHYVPAAIAAGSSVVVCERLVEPIQPITYVVVESTREALGIMAANFYDWPSQKLKLVAVTGTNGKTTIVHLLYTMAVKMGYKVGMFSTIYNKILHETYPAQHTTPDALQLQRLLHLMVDAGCTYCFMEASSHAIVQKRITGLHFAGAVFTNITHEHLDYHLDFKNYIYAKKKLFDDLPKTAFALVNKQDKNSSILLQNCRAKQFTFSLEGLSDFSARVITATLQGTELAIGNKAHVWFQLVGTFNASNLLAVYATAQLLQWNPQESLIALSAVPPIVGRMNRVNHGAEGPQVFIDFAHTPDALEQVISILHHMLPPGGRLLTVMGCGGNRDAQKRAMIGKILASKSDLAIFTSDNPRNEDPLAIIRQMQEGLSAAENTRVLSVVDRTLAIETACLLAGVKDVVLMGGKGHQCYEEIKGVKYRCDESEIIQKTLQTRICRQEKE